MWLVSMTFKVELQHQLSLWSISLEKLTSNEITVFSDGGILGRFLVNMSLTIKSIGAAYLDLSFFDDS